MLIDTHCHLNFTVFDSKRREIISQCFQNNMQCIVVGTNLKTSQKAVELAQQYSNLYAAVGLHPMELDTGLVKIKPDAWEGIHFEAEFNYERYKELAQNSKVVAIGEIGLDYYTKPKTTRRKELFKQKQKELLLREWQLAKELNLPVIFHCRMANKDLIELLKNNKNLRPSRAVIHSFVGTLEEMKTYLSLGYYIGFNGIIFKDITGINFPELIKEIPLNRMLLETDSPYLKPPAMKGEINTPLGVKYVAKKVAEIKNISLEQVASLTTKNAQNLFGIKQ